jgi:hypothetical protein
MTKDFGDAIRGGALGWGLGCPFPNLLKAPNISGTKCRPRREVRIHDPMRETFRASDLGSHRLSCVPRATVFCKSISCNHSSKLKADWLPDETVLLTLDPAWSAPGCGLIGADVDWIPHTEHKPLPGTSRRP